MVETKGANGCRVHRHGVPSTKELLDEDNRDAILVPLQVGVVDIVDATGAGDAFIAGFLDKWMEVQMTSNGRDVTSNGRDVTSNNRGVSSVTDEELIACCRRGHSVAGLNVQRIGACRVPITVDELDE